MKSKDTESTETLVLSILGDREMAYRDILAKIRTTRPNFSRGAVHNAIEMLTLKSKLTERQGWPKAACVFEKRQARLQKLVRAAPSS